MKLRNPFKQRKLSPVWQETFVHLLRAAQEDDDFRHMLCGILRQPSFHRQSLLNSTAQRAAAGGQHRCVVEAIQALADDAVAERALEMLME